ncbi:MAG: hypothetical protein QOC57_1984, partial [Ilumatobacteraceae bacterium]
GEGERDLSWMNPLGTAIQYYQS